MDCRPFWCLFVKFIWVLFFLLDCVSSQSQSTVLSLTPRVYVILPGEDLTVTIHLQKPANQSTHFVKCWDPLKNEIYREQFPETYQLTAKIKNLSVSGEYYCKYEENRVYWFLRVVDVSRKMLSKTSTEVVIVAVLTGMLLVFSVIGSVYVFRGQLISKSDKTGRKGKQKKEERKKTEIEDGDAYVKTAPSTSVYASLEPRTRSIYDELDHFASVTKPEQQRPKPRNKEANKTKLESTQDQDEGQIESVYENY